MARTNLKVISVYLNDKDYNAVKKASEMENRSMSNFLHTVGVQAAYERLENPVFGTPDPEPVGSRDNKR